MNEDYCSYELALKLKACGFDEPCEAFYLPPMKNRPEPFFSGRVRRSIKNESHAFHFSAPSLYAAQKWLREKKGIAINVIAHDGGVYDYDIVFLPNAVDCDCPIDRATFSRTYEEALSEGITSVLELIKKARNLFRRNSDFF